MIAPAPTDSAAQTGVGQVDLKATVDGVSGTGGKAGPLIDRGAFTSLGAGAGTLAVPDAQACTWWPRGRGAPYKGGQGRSWT